MFLHWEAQKQGVNKGNRGQCYLVTVMLPLTNKALVSRVGFEPFAVKGSV